MKIGLIDVDGHNYPNLPLMKLSAWHKKQGDSVEWYQPMFSGHMDRVYMSKVFSFTPDYEYPIDADEVIRGGTGYAIKLVNGKEIYDKEKDMPLSYEIEHIYPDYDLYKLIGWDHIKLCFSVLAKTLISLQLLSSIALLLEQHDKNHILSDNL